MTRAADIYSVPPGIDGTPNATIESADWNAFTADVAQDLNFPRPIVAGGTGASTAAVARDATHLQVERSMAVVTNYDTQVWEPGSFYSASSATSPPVAGHAFAGIVYGPDQNNLVIEARDLDDTSIPGIVYVREKKAGVWEPTGWKTDAYVKLTGDTMSGDLTITKATPRLFLNSTDATPGVIVQQRSGSARWVEYFGTGAETGANAGSDYALERYSDAAASLGFPVIINRALGHVLLAGVVTSNVGIGVASPTAPVARLEISSPGSPPALQLSQFGSNADFMRFVGAASPSNNKWAIRIRDLVEGDFAIRDNTANLNRFYINAAGNVGISTTTPGYLSSVLTSAARFLSLYSTERPNLELVNGAADAAGNFSQVSFLADANTVGGPVSKLIAAIQSISSGVTANNRGGELSFGTKADGGGYAERMRITNSGQVGINTPPAAFVQLHVSCAGVFPLRITDTNVANASWDFLAQTGNTTKMFRLMDATAGVDRLRIDASGNVTIGSTTALAHLHVEGANTNALDYTNGDAVGGTLFLADSTLAGGAGGAILFSCSAYPVPFAGIRASLQNGTGPSGDLAFQARATTGNVRERMRISGSGGSTGLGGVGIGTGGALTAFGLLSVRFPGSNWGIGIDDSPGVTTHQFVQFLATGGSIGGIANLNNTSVQYNTTSDRTRKEDEKRFDRAPSIIDALQVWDFKWKGVEERGVGVFAQDAAEVFSDAVCAPTETMDVWMIDYSKFVPVLISDAQETHARLAAIEQQLGIASPRGHA